MAIDTIEHALKIIRFYADASIVDLELDRGMKANHALPQLIVELTAIQARLDLLDSYELEFGKLTDFQCSICHDWLEDSNFDKCIFCEDTEDDDSG